MKLKHTLFTLIILLSFCQGISFTASAAENRIRISTLAGRPLYVDRLAYTAFNTIGINADFFASSTLEQGLKYANDGECDGVISSYPNISTLYPNLRRVPVPLESGEVFTVIRTGNSYRIADYSDLKGKRIGVLTDPYYITSKLPEDALITYKDTTDALMSGLLEYEYDMVVFLLGSHESLKLPAGLKKSQTIDEFYEYLYLNQNRWTLIPETTRSLNDLFSGERAENILNNVISDDENTRKTILHIISSSSEITRERQFNATLRENFSEDSLEFYYIELNLKRFSDNYNRLSYYAGLLRQDSISRDIAAVIVSGSDAFDFLMEYYYAFFKNTPVIFYSVDETHVQEAAVTENIMGIYEALPSFDTVSWALSVFESVENLYVVNDYTRSGRDYHKKIANQLESLSREINIEYNENLDYNSLFEYMESLPPNSLILMGSYFQDNSGKFFSQNETKIALSKITSAPIVSFYSTDLPFGAIGGRCLDYEKNSELVSAILKKILDENAYNEVLERLTALPVYNSGEFSRWVFDKNSLDRWGISEKRLPAGSQVLNETPGIWETNPEYAYSMTAIVVLCIIVIIGLFAFLKQYRKQNGALLAARADLHTKEELLAKDAEIHMVNERITKLISSAPISYLMAVDGVIVEINDNMKTDVGLSIGDSMIGIFAEPGERDIIISILLKENFIKNRIVKLNFANGEIHRCLLNTAVSEYEGKTSFVLWGTDIEKDERKKDEIHAERQNLQTILDTMPLPISIVDSNTHSVVYGNNLYLKLMGVESVLQIPPLGTSEFSASLQSDDMSPAELAELFLSVKEPMTKEIMLYKDDKITDLRLSACSIEYNGSESVIGIMTDLQAEKENKKMRQNLQTILDNLPIPVGITLNEDYSILYVNNYCAELFGYDSPESMYEISISDLYTKNRENRAPFIELLKLVNETQVSDVNEIEYVTTKGKSVTAQIITCPIDYIGKKATLGIIRDMSQELEHRKIRESLQTVLDVLPIPVRILELATATTLYVNNSFLEMFEKTSADDMLGSNVLEVISSVQKDGETREEKLLRITNSKETFSMEVDYITPSGKHIDSLLISSHIDFKGTPSSLGIIKDLTAEKEQQKMLLNAAEREKEANQLKSRFLVNMSHEIRTPMNAIIGLSEIELRKRHEKTINDAFKKINVSAEGLLQIINEILDFSKIEADKIELAEDEFCLEEVLNSTVIVSSPRLVGKPVDILLETDAKTPRFVIGDDIRLWQVLKNFLDNAAKFTDKGEIMFSVKTNDALTTNDEIGITFIVEDMGIGMSEEQLDTVFMPYEQFYSESQKKYTGTGLGMPIAKQLAELMGGSIEITSTPNAGTKIVTNIPFRRSQKNKDASLIPVSLSLSEKNMLIVESNEFSAGAIKNILVHNNVNCFFAKDNATALETANELAEKGILLDAVLISYMMDKRGELDSIRLLAKQLDNIYKIVMVPVNQKNVVEMDSAYSLANDVDGVIERPLMPMHFIEELSHILGINNEEIDFDIDDSEQVEFTDVTVLVCEDNPINQEVAAGLLEYLGIESVMAENGKQAIELLNEGCQFDLIFMDLQMPVMNGYETAEYIRSDSRYDNVPIVSLSADAMPEISKKCLDAGMNDNLAKPIDFDELHNVLLKWLPAEKRIM